MASPSSWLDSGAVSKLRDFTEKLLIMSNKNNNNLENHIQIENMVSSQLLLGYGCWMTTQTIVYLPDLIYQH